VQERARILFGGSQDDATTIYRPRLLFRYGVLLAIWNPRFTTLALAHQEQPDADDRTAMAMVESAKEVFDGHARMKLALSGLSGDDFEFLYRWSKRWLEAERTIDKAKKKQIAAYSTHLDRMKKLEEIQQAQFDVGKARKYDVAAARFYRIEAERWLGEAKSKK
jgi:hypothetical protein